MKRPRLRKLHNKKRRIVACADPGCLVGVAAGKASVVHVMSYCGDHFEERSIEKLQDLRAYLDNASSIAWIDVRGLTDEKTLREIGEIFRIHPLALEDVAHTQQRPKVEDYDHHQFIIARMVMLHGPDDMGAEQLSIFLGSNYVLTFHDDVPDCLDPVRVRLKKRAGVHRRMGADYLCYTIIDAIVDHYFPVLESYGEYLDHLEEQTVSSPRKATLSAIHTAKRELMDLRRVLWPQREMLNQLVRAETSMIGKDVQVFLRDCYDHSVQVMDMVENYREIVGGLHDVYLSSLANRTNEIMKVLTIISTIFIPLTFIAGIYGMNFSPTPPDKNDNPMNMPELYSPYGYPLTMLGMAAIAASLLYYFWRKGWIFEKAEESSKPVAVAAQAPALPDGPSVPYLRPPPEPIAILPNVEKPSANHSSAHGSVISGVIKTEGESAVVRNEKR